ncbi:hypothetical protein V1514DRAFT_340743 [Lipomyces japonicus]|uniref:uncharacterized protein n=1 Tax=Lipomyces japonicus TaxID=56871 RepID=UPI0034CDAEE9
MSHQRRAPYGGAVGMKSSASMDFHTSSAGKNASALAAASAVAMSRSNSSTSLSSAAAATALRKASKDSVPSSLVAPSKRAAQRASLQQQQHHQIERRPSLSERTLRPQSVGPDTASRKFSQQQQHRSGFATTLRSNSFTSSRSLMAISSKLRPGNNNNSSSNKNNIGSSSIISSGNSRRSGYASSVLSYESDLNSISEDLTLDTSSVLSSPKLVAASHMPPAIQEEDFEVRSSIKHVPPPRTLSPTKSALRDSSRPSSVLSARSSNDELSNSAKRKAARVSFTNIDEPPPKLPGFDNVTPSSPATTPAKLADVVATPAAANGVTKKITKPNVIESPKPTTKANSTVAKTTQFRQSSSTVSNGTVSRSATPVVDQQNDDNEDDMFEDALEVLEFPDKDYPDILSVIETDTKSSSQAKLADTHLTSTSQTKVIAKPVAVRQVTTRQQQSPHVAAASIPATAVVVTKPGTAPVKRSANESDSGSRWQAPELLHPTPRNATNVSGILKNSALDNQQKSLAARKPVIAQQQVTPLSKISHSNPGKSLKSLKTTLSTSTQPVPPLPSFQKNATSLANVNANAISGRQPRRHELRSSSSFERLPNGNTRGQFKSSLRDAAPAAPTTRATSQNDVNSSSGRNVLHHKAREIASQAESYGIPSLTRSDSDSSFKRENRRPVEPIGFKPQSQVQQQKLRRKTSPLDDSDSDFNYENNRYGAIPIKSRWRRKPAPLDDSDLDEDEDADDDTTRWSERLGFGRAVSSTVNATRSRIESSGDEDIEIGVLHGGNSFAGDDQHQHQHQNHDGANSTGVSILASDNHAQELQPQLPPVPVPLEPSEPFTEPRTPTKTRRLSQYQQHKLERAQKKEARERDRAERKAGLPVFSSPAVTHHHELQQQQQAASTMSGGDANAHLPAHAEPVTVSTDFVPGRKKKFGKLRRLFGFND